MVLPWKLRFKETAVLQSKRAGPKETRKLDHRKASRDFYFEIGNSLGSPNSLNNKETKMPVSLVLGESRGSPGDRRPTKQKPRVFHLLSSWQSELS